MVLLTKDIALFDRDEKGELVPIEVDLIIDEDDELQKQYIGLSIAIIPLMRGEIKKTLGVVLSNEDKEKKDLDGDIIQKHCTTPAFTKEEIVQLRPAFATSIVNTILFHSGLNITLPKKDAVKKSEDELSKN